MLPPPEFAHQFPAAFAATAASVPLMPRAHLAVPLSVELLVEHRQGDVGQQRGQDSANAMGNFCFEVSLGYRRLERLPRVTGGG